MNILYWILFITMFLPLFSKSIVKWLNEPKYFHNIYDGSIWQLVDTIKKNGTKYYVLVNPITGKRIEVPNEDLDETFNY